MSATIHLLSAARALRATPGSEASVQPLDLTKRFHFWRGASGAAYVHTVSSLVGCPQMPAANIVLVRRGADGQRTVLKIGRVEHDAPSLNLAEVRQTGASLGANEVHVHLLADDALQRRRVELDIRAGQMPEPQRANIPAARS